MNATSKLLALLIILLLTLAGPSTASAQDTPPVPYETSQTSQTSVGCLTPEEATEKALTLLGKRHIDKYIELIHPDAAREYMDIMWPRIERQFVDSDSLGKRQLVKMYNLKTRNKALIKPTPDEFMLNIATSAFGWLPEELPLYEILAYETLGIVKESDTIVHVVTRTTRKRDYGLTVERVSGVSEPMHIKFDQVDVTTLRKHQNCWLLAVTPDMSEGAALFKFMFPSITPGEF